MEERNGKGGAVEVRRKSLKNTVCPRITGFPKSVVTKKTLTVQTGGKETRSRGQWKKKKSEQSVKRRSGKKRKK